MCRYSFAYSPYIPSINSVFFSSSFFRTQARLEVPVPGRLHLSGVLLMELSRRLQHLYTLFLVLVSWAIFAVEDFGHMEPTSRPCSAWAAA